MNKSLWVSQVNKRLIWLGQLLATIEAIDLKDADTTDADRVRDVSDKVLSAAHRSTRGQKVINQKSFRASWEHVLLDLHGVSAILERVALLPALTRKLSLLAHSDEGQAPLECQDGSKDEAFRL